MKSDYSYYDFEDNFSTYYTLFKSKEVQKLLSVSMRDWIRHPTIENTQTDIMKIPTSWMTGYPLWMYSLNNYHDLKIKKKVDMIIKDMNMVSKFEQCQQLLSNTEPYMKSFKSSVYDILYSEQTPALHTLESMILINGETHLGSVFLHIANILFPESNTYILYNRFYQGCCICPDRKLIFDPNKYYMYKYEDRPDLDPNKVAAEYENRLP